jgi:hypothetical protein
MSWMKMPQDRDKGQICYECGNEPVGSIKWGFLWLAEELFNFSRTLHHVVGWLVKVALQHEKKVLQSLHMVWFVCFMICCNVYLQKVFAPCSYIKRILVNTKNKQNGLCAGLFLLCLISSCGFEPKRKSVFSRMQKCVQNTADCVEILYWMVKCGL